MSPELESMLLVASGVIAGLTSFPLVYLAVHSHRQLAELQRSHRKLHRIADTRGRPHTPPATARATRYPSRRVSSR